MQSNSGNDTHLGIIWLFFHFLNHSWWFNLALIYLLRFSLKCFFLTHLKTFSSNSVFSGKEMYQACLGRESCLVHVLHCQSRSLLPQVLWPGCWRRAGLIGSQDRHHHPCQQSCHLLPGRTQKATALPIFAIIKVFPLFYNQKERFFCSQIEQVFEEKPTVVSSSHPEANISEKFPLALCWLQNKHQRSIAAFSGNLSIQMPSASTYPHASDEVETFSCQGSCEPSPWQHCRILRRFLCYFNKKRQVNKSILLPGRKIYFVSLRKKPYLKLIKGT